MTGGRVSERLPTPYWSLLEPATKAAQRHPDGLVDLSLGSPPDPTPQVLQTALAEAADAPGYPTTAGRADLLRSCRDWLARRFGVTDLSTDAVLPVIGTKELIASLPSHLGLGAQDLVVVPELAYPTYTVGARLAGARTVAADATTATGPEPVALFWLNSPSNPTGKVLPVEHLRKVVAWARERGTIVVSDECYLEYGWDTQPVSVLHPDVCDGSHEGILTVQSVSKRSNAAGYRCGFLAGDAGLVAELRSVRRQLGLMLPAPQQRAMAAALDDDAHVDEQRSRYLRRRRVLWDALRAAGFGIDHSEASLYLWATRDEPCWDTVDRLADLGILVAPGDFYGRSGARHVRVALTTTDERVDAAADRLHRAADRWAAG